MVKISSPILSMDPKIPSQKSQAEAKSPNESPQGSQLKVKYPMKPQQGSQLKVKSPANPHNDLQCASAQHGKVKQDEANGDDSVAKSPKAFHTGNPTHIAEVDPGRVPQSPNHHSATLSTQSSAQIRDAAPKMTTQCSCQQRMHSKPWTCHF